MNSVHMESSNLYFLNKSCQLTGFQKHLGADFRQSLILLGDRIHKTCPLHCLCGAKMKSGIRVCKIKKNTSILTVVGAGVGGGA